MSGFALSRWTLRDAVVATGVVVVLASLVVAALPLARERARRGQCQENLRQIGLALQSYHQANGMLPPAAIRDDPTFTVPLRDLNSREVRYRLHVVYANWAMLLLPHLGRDDVAALVRPGLPVTDAANAAARGAALPGMRCPSDHHHREENPYRAAVVDGPQAEFARGNYAINGGVLLGDYPGKPWYPVTSGRPNGYDAAGRRQAWGSGVAGFNKSFAVEQFQKGLSNLVGIDEVRAGLTPDDSRGAWALGEIGASVTWGHGLIGDDPGPNCRNPRADDIVGCNPLHEVFGEERLIEEGMPCCSYSPVAGQATARSLHPGGVNLLVMDGSAKFVADEVDGNVWHGMHSHEEGPWSVVSGQLQERGQSSVVNGQLQESCPLSVVSGELRKPVAGLVHPLPSGVESIRNGIGMRLVRVRAGEFVMGLPDEGQDRHEPVTGVPAETPPHRVRISEDFWLGAFEVTQQEYQRVMGVNPSWHCREGGGKARVLGEDTARFPVEQVSWIDAAAFCERLSALPEEKRAGRRYRLPTEAEWEYACRGGSSEPFRVPGQEEAESSGFNMRPDGTRGLPVRPAGSYPPNAFGLYDMRGNVFEWCADWFAWDYYQRSGQEDPQGPATGVLRVVRGADWRFTGMACKHTKFDAEPWRTNPFLGFRVACEMEK